MLRPNLDARMRRIAQRCMAQHGARAAILASALMSRALSAGRIDQARKWRLVRDRIWQMQGSEG